MNEAPKKIYWDVQDRIADENQDDPSETPYIRADIVDELVEALKELLKLHDNEVFVAEPWEVSMEEARAALKKLEESHD